MSKQRYYSALAAYKELEPDFNAAKRLLSKAGYELETMVMSNSLKEYGLCYTKGASRIWLNKDTVKSILATI